MNNHYLMFSRDFLERYILENDIECTSEGLQTHLKWDIEDHYLDCGEYPTPDDFVILQTVDYINGLTTEKYIQKQIEEVRIENVKKEEQVTLQLSKEELDLLEYQSEGYKVSYPDLYNKIHKLHRDLKND